MANILLSYVEVFKKARPYSLYVLFIMLTTYMLNQLDRYTLSITNIRAAQDIHFGDMACMKFDNGSKEEGAACKNITNKADCEDYRINGTNVCKYDYNGQGLEYQIVAGPAFILVFTFTGIILSLFADRFRQWRVFILAGCLTWWSAMTVLTGFIESYWQLVVLRFGLGFGEAGCNPLATSLITDYFPIELRGAALGIYNWGIYLGYSMSFAIGNQILKHLSWRWVYYISGIPGFVVAILIVLTVRRPKPPEETSINYQTLNLQQEDSNATKLKKVIKEFFKPSILFLCLAGSIRNAAGYVWGYNNNTYYKMMGQTPDQISSYLGTIPLVFGIIGSFVGGFVSDRVAKQAKPWIRIWVLVISQISAAPFVFGVLYFKPPVSYYFLIPAYVFGEMWVGVCLSVLVELVPEKLRTTGIGFYFFVISNIGGNMQTFVPLVQDFFKKTFKLNNDDAFRAALYLFYPGEYVIGAALFLLTLFVLKRDLNRMQANVIDENASVRDLIVENSTAADDDENEKEESEGDDKSSGKSELVD